MRWLKSTWKLIVLSTVTSFLLLSTSACSAETGARPTDISTGDPILRQIDRFWALSLERDEEALQRLVSDIPEDFYKDLNRCWEETGEIAARRLNSRPGDLIEIARGVNDDLQRYERGELWRFSRAIADEPYPYHRVVDIKRRESQAIVKVAFGTQSDHLRSTLFLMTKVDGEWKVFMTPPKSYFDKQYPYFLKDDCFD